MDSGIKIKYMECQKGGFHQGEQLNTVCLNSQCRFNPLCCCSCVDEYHNGHKTTTLKKILIDAKQSANQLQGQKKESVKSNSVINTDILHNMLQMSKMQTFQRLSKTSESIRLTLNQIQQGLKLYYDNLESTIQNQGNSNPTQKIFQSIQNIQGAVNLSTMVPALQQLLTSFQHINNQKSSNQVGQSLSQDSLINLIQHSNRQVNQTCTKKLTEIRNQLVKSSQVVFEASMNIKSLFSRDIFKFSDSLKSTQIWTPQSHRAVSKKGQTYQVILMEPGINTSGEITAFKFKINKSTSNWIAVGMCHKNIIQSKKFLFDYKNIGHGCYLISTNAGTWSHITEDLNNKVKAFSFKQGDTITCIVNRKLKQIFFVKDIPYGVLNVSVSQRQVYQLPYIQNSYDPLHPCVVFYYQNDEVEYIPAINYNSIPRYEFLFSQTWKHARVKVIDNRMIKALEGNNQYRAVLLNKCLQQNFDTVKKFSFRVIKSSNNWVAVGMCHSKTAANSNYGFNYQSAFHGYYMVSSNGGTWSTIDSKKNNVVKSFKFTQGDVIECQVQFGNGPTDLNNKIIFRKGLQSYELNFKGVQGDRLYPCAMVHFAHDQIGILPSF